MDILHDDYVNRLDGLLQGMQAANEAGLFGKDAEESGKNFRRIQRTILSQGNDLFYNNFEKYTPEQLRDPAVAVPAAKGILSQAERVQKEQNYAPGVVQGHHYISINSIEAASAHLPLRERLTFLKELNDSYQSGGTNGWDMFGLTKFAHQGHGRNTTFTHHNAHATNDPTKLLEGTGYPVDTSTWQSEDFTDITDPIKLADEFMNRSGFPQMMYADRAHDSPEEIAFRTELAKALNIEPKQLELFGYNKPSRKGANPISLPNAIRDRIKAYGIDVEAIMHRAYNKALSANRVAPTPQAPKPAPKPTASVAPKPAPKPTPAPKVIPPTAARKPNTPSVKEQLKTQPTKAPPPKATTVLPSQAKPKPKPQLKPNKPARTSLTSSGTRTRGHGGVRGSGTRADARGSIGTSPLSPLNKGSNLYGATERKTNDFVQDMPGWSPHWLKLAD